MPATCRHIVRRHPPEDHLLREHHWRLREIIAYEAVDAGMRKGFNKVEQGWG
jgi:hypothetical protein